MERKVKGDRGGTPLVPLSSPQRGVAGETGDWRTSRPDLNQEACTGCLTCWMYCPEGAIERKEKNVEINLKYCKGCGVCAEECPVGAIKMVEER